jgi:hypothetical protein
MTPLEQLRQETHQRLAGYRPLRYRLFAPLMIVAGLPTLGVVPLLCLVSRFRAMAAWLSETLADLVTLLRSCGHDTSDVWRLEQVARHLADQRAGGRTALAMGMTSLALAALAVPAAVLLFVLGGDRPMLWRWAVLLVAFYGSWVLLLVAAFARVQQELSVQMGLVREGEGHLSAVAAAAGAPPLTRQDAPPPMPPWAWPAALAYLPTLWGVLMVRLSVRWSHHVRVVVKRLAAETADRLVVMAPAGSGNCVLVVRAEAAAGSRTCPDPRCGAANVAEATFCQRCGRKLDA